MEREKKKKELNIYILRTCKNFAHGFKMKIFKAKYLSSQFKLSINPNNNKKKNYCKRQKRRKYLKSIIKNFKFMIDKFVYQNQIFIKYRHIINDNIKFYYIL